jgi:hypothetical protein
VFVVAVLCGQINSLSLSIFGKLYYRVFLKISSSRMVFLKFLTNRHDSDLGSFFGKCRHHVQQYSFKIFHSLAMCHGISFLDTFSVHGPRPIAESFSIYTNTLFKMRNRYIEFLELHTLDIKSDSLYRVKVPTDITFQ